MKKAFDQTVRDLKREVNKKVLKVPSIEQKVLDATSNEPWGPHGTLLADIAQATRNYHEYQMIMSIIWKRINDTGKNWRHVYKALIVLEYLVGHGSERVIDEIKEHGYQIQTLSDFQYIDSGGRDQGSNVRKKSQSLVVLVNDKERVIEVRQKAAANRDKFRNTSTGNMYRPGSYGSPGGYGDRYDDDRYGNRDEDRYGYGREREYGYRDDDRYGRYGEPYSYDRDQSGRESEEYYSRDDENRGRHRSVDEFQYGSRSRSSDTDRDRNYEDNGENSSRRLERKYSEQNLGAPPNYEEAIGVARSPVHNERDGETSSASAPKSSSPPASSSPSQANGMVPPIPAPASSPAPAQNSALPPAPALVSASPPTPVVNNSEADGFDEFDPRGAFSAAGAAPSTSGNTEMDLLGSLSDSLALVPATSFTASSDAETSVSSAPGPTFAETTSQSSISHQTFHDPFGDGPFQAIPSTDDLSGHQNSFPASSFPPVSNVGSELPQQVYQKVETVGFSGETFPAGASTPFGASSVQPPSNMNSLQLSAPDPNLDVLADILPPAGPQPLVNSQVGFPAPTNPHVQQPGFLPQVGEHPSGAALPPQSGPTAYQTGVLAQPGLPSSVSGFPAQSGQPSGQTSFAEQFHQSVPQAHLQSKSGQLQSLTSFANQTGQAPQTAAPVTQSSSISGFPSHMGPFSQGGLQTLPGGQSAQPNAISYGGYNLQPGSAAPVGQHMASQGFTGPAAPKNLTNDLTRSSSGVTLASQMSLPGAQEASSAPVASQMARAASTGSLATAPQTAKDKLETKSSVWSDSLSRGLVNLNISGPKTNSDIGIDFDALNRKEKRMEKPSTNPPLSTVTMGRAMGSGSGMGRAGAGAPRPPQNPVLGAGMGMSMSGGPRPGVGMGGYAGMNQLMGGMGMNMQPNMGMGMNMGIGGAMQQPSGYPPGPTFTGGYNPMMGAGAYGQQPPGAYR